MTKEELKTVEDLNYIVELFSELARRGVKQVFDGLLEVRPMLNVNIINKEDFEQ